MLNKTINQPSNLLSTAVGSSWQKLPTVEYNRVIYSPYYSYIISINSNRGNQKL